MELPDKIAQVSAKAKEERDSPSEFQSYSLIIFFKKLFKIKFYNVCLHLSLLIYMLTQL